MKKEPERNPERNPEHSPLLDYIITLKSYKVNLDKGHWVPENHNRSKIRLALEKTMKEEGVLIPGYELRKVCRVPYCVHPLHYRVIPSLSQVPNPEEVEELVDLIDVEVCEKLGFERYLVLFNEDNPLPATREVMRAAVAIALSRAKKTIPLDDIFWKGIEDG